MDSYFLNFLRLFSLIHINFRMIQRGGIELILIGEFNIKQIAIRFKLVP